MGQLKSVLGQRKGAVARYAIAGKVRKSHLAYKVKVQARLAW